VHHGFSGYPHALLYWSTYCSDPELIYLTDGASKGVMQMLNATIRNGRDGVWLSLKSRIFPPNFYAISAED
jgi:hypothetical protein